MRYTKVLCVISLFLLAGSAALAKEFWETKAYDQWSEKECQKLLTDSPWAKVLDLTGMNNNNGSGAAMNSQAPYVKYTIQLRSVDLIRQATVRQMQLMNKYDAMSADQKKAFDQSVEGFLAGTSSDVVVVHVSFDTNNRDHQQSLLRHWGAQTVDLLKNSVYLSGSKGEKVSLVQFVPVQGAAQEFQFIFPREVDGKEVLKPTDKALQLEFVYPVVGERGSELGDGNGFIEFKTDKMKVNGSVVY